MTGRPEFVSAHPISVGITVSTMKNVIVLAAAVLLLPAAASAARGVECSLEIYQIDTTGRDVLLMADTAALARNVMASGFLLAFSADIEVSRVDSTRADFITHVVTLGPPAHTYSRSFSAEYGLPARIDSIRGKEGAVYSFVIRPLAPVEVDTAYCPFIHRVEGAFERQPSAHLDLLYVPQSFGHFYWTSVKGLFESFYRQFQAQFKLTLPGKVNVFLCPCLLNSVIWDTRFGQSIDPTRNTAYSLFAKDVNSTDPFLVTHGAVLRTFGYAPPFISEGWGNYLSFAEFDMKRLLADGTAPSLDSMLDTYTYLKADPMLADRMSATFVKFLIDTYGQGKLKEFYRSVHDLNLRHQLTDVYGLTVGELDSAWRHYVDTLSIAYSRLGSEAQKAEVMFNYRRMEDYAEAMLARAPAVVDSQYSYSVLTRARFFSGDYYGAVESAEAQLQLDRTLSRNWLAPASYLMMNGLYDRSREYLLNGLAVDSTDQMLVFNLALNALYTGDTTQAESLFVEIVSDPSGRVAQGESRILLGELLMDGSAADSARAMTLFSEARQAYLQQLQANESSPSVYMWLGVASMGFGDNDNAYNWLQTALFIETRPFYIGMINLWLGKLMDVMGDHEAAEEYYAAVLSGTSADYHQREARYLIENPYSL